MDLLGKVCVSATACFRWDAGVPPDSILGTDMQTTKQEMQLLSLSAGWNFMDSVGQIRLPIHHKLTSPLHFPISSLILWSYNML